jgi:hypothetical protein
MSADRHENTIDPGAVASSCLESGGKIAEQQGRLIGAVIGVLSTQGVRIDPKARRLIDFGSVLAACRALLYATGSPERLTAERLLEMTNGLHCDCVDQLLMELRIAFRRRTAIAGEKFRRIQINRIVEAVRGRIDIHYLDIFADRPWLQVFFPGDGHRCLVHGDRRHRLRDAWVERVDREPAWRRLQLLLLAPDRRRRLVRDLSQRRTCGRDGFDPDRGLERGAQRRGRVAAFERRLEIAPPRWGLHHLRR